MGTIDSVLGKLDNPTLGQALGFVMAEFKYDQENGTPMLGYLMRQIEHLMKEPHFPNIAHVVDGLTRDTCQGQTFKGSLMAGVAGWILDEIDMNPTISRLGKTLKSLGFNAALGVTAAVLLDESSIAYSDGGAPPGQPYGGHNGYPRGAGYSPLGRRDGGYFTMPNVPPAGTPNIGAVLPASPRP